MEQLTRAEFLILARNSLLFPAVKPVFGFAPGQPERQQTDPWQELAATFPVPEPSTFLTDMGTDFKALYDGFPLSLPDHEIIRPSSAQEYIDTYMIPELDWLIEMIQQQHSDDVTDPFNNPELQNTPWYNFSSAKGSLLELIQSLREDVGTGRVFVRTIDTSLWSLGTQNNAYNNNGQAEISNSTILINNADLQQTMYIDPWGESVTISSLNLTVLLVYEYCNVLNGRALAEHLNRLYNNNAPDSQTISNHVNVLSEQLKAQGKYLSPFGNIIQMALGRSIQLHAGSMTAQLEGLERLYIFPPYVDFLYGSLDVPDAQRARDNVISFLSQTAGY